MLKMHLLAIEKNWGARSGRSVIAQLGSSVLSSGLPVELLEAEATVVLLLDLPDGVPQQLQNVLHILLVHHHLKEQSGHHLGCIRQSTCTCMYSYIGGPVCKLVVNFNGSKTTVSFPV